MPGDEMRQISEDSDSAFPLVALIATTTACRALLIKSHINRVAGRRLFSRALPAVARARLHFRTAGKMTISSASISFFFFPASPSSPPIPPPPPGVTQLVLLEATFAEEQLAGSTCPL